METSPDAGAAAFSAAGALTAIEKDGDEFALEAGGRWLCYNDVVDWRCWDREITKICKEEEKKSMRGDVFKMAMSDGSGGVNFIRCVAPSLRVTDYDIRDHKNI
jgi:hypothetical protein